VDERLDFIAAHHSGLYSMSELCLRFGISRRIGYKWLHRYQAEGPAGLLEKSHAPQHYPHKLSAEIRAVLPETKRAHPSGVL
jgi:transposase